MSVSADALKYQKLIDDHGALRLLRAANAPVVLAVLDNHLGGKTRRLPTFELANLVEADLEELRLRTSLELPRSAQAYCDQWRLEGFLVRKPSDQPKVETYELSAASLAALQFVKGLLEPQRVATHSRLSTIVDAIQKLARDTDDDVMRRKASLLAEREALDNALALLDEGIVDILDEERALEQARDIMDISQQIPADFLNVTADFEAINARLHASILNSDEESTRILEDVFAGVNHIQQSPSGRSFNGFFGLLRDPALTESVQAALDDILSRSFASSLKAEERHRLRNLLRDFLARSFEVHDVMTQFAQGLRRYVQEQSYQEQRHLKKLIDQTLALSHKLAATTPLNQNMETRLNLTYVRMRPVSRWQLHDPGLYRSEDKEENVPAPVPTLSLEDLRRIVRESEIDTKELVENVNSALADKRSSSPAGTIITPAEVLERFPATQGVASVVGLVGIAMQQGRLPEKQKTETVHWTRKDGLKYKASIPQFEFYQEVTL